ncbi:transcription factor bHLH100-like isoform X1 [Ananas comosus]|uniref:Protein IRON-RELATED TRANSCRIPTION FACTOR 2 n=1 Tax=Ananas comosus TaxID=4615 RepID=A0A6P5EIJ0_ANACO|nr:transcription factor bHLH100-like isoform X1 [Ananas comosus]XP_020087425.1 transcription factor bHLH100-like isoform X1 [Ananas comosus]
MLALSPPLFSSPLENNVMSNELRSDDRIFASNRIQHEDGMLQQSLLFPSPPHPELEFDDQSRASNSAKDSPRSHKKLSHNAYERDRRKKLNSFYSSLRTLLPESDRTQKKMSIPSTVSRIVKYIPELQSQVARLSRRKEEVLAEIAKRKEGSPTKEGIEFLINVSATCLNSEEVMVHITVLNKNISLPLSKFLKVLEGEGLQLMNASTLTSFGDKTFYNLHFQIKRCTGMEGQIFCEHLVKVIKEKGRDDYSSIQ